MKRSEVNELVRESLEFLREMKFRLPAFATWSPDEWRSKGEEVAEIVDAQLGWDITDFGSGDFASVGLVLFTIRNGIFGAPSRSQNKPYAEKILITRADQVTPTHFHYQKMEDIINRGGGTLIVQLWNSLPDKSRADTPVEVSLDGVRVRVPAGGTIALRPGDSVCLPPRLYHKFWGEPGCGRTLIGEVSRVNDDRVDNYFHEGVGRFPDIEEDVAPLHLLTLDYPSYYKDHATRTRAS